MIICTLFVPGFPQGKVLSSQIQTAAALCSLVWISKEMRASDTHGLPLTTRQMDGWLYVRVLLFTIPRENYNNILSSFRVC